MTATFDPSISTFRCSTETTLDLLEVIERDLEQFLDLLDELEGADYGEERIATANGVEYELGPLQEQDCIPIGVTENAEIRVRIEGIRDGTPVDWR